MQIIKTIDSKFYRELGNEIRRIRQDRRLTLSQISKLTGYSRPLIDRWELGLTRIKDYQFENLCKALDVTNNVFVEVKVGFFA